MALFVCILHCGFVLCGEKKSGVARKRAQLFLVMTLLYCGVVDPSIICRQFESEILLNLHLEGCMESHKKDWIFIEVFLRIYNLYLGGCVIYTFFVVDTIIKSEITQLFPQIEKREKSLFLVGMKKTN